MAGNYCKFQRQKRQVSYNNGGTWVDVYPPEYQKGVLLGCDEADCGYYPPIYRWQNLPLDEDYICEGYNRYYKQKYQVSNDNGRTWEDIIPLTYQRGNLVQQNSPICGFPITRWVDLPIDTDWVCFMTDKYYKQKLQQSTDNGTTWTDVNPPQFQRGVVYQRNSPDCICDTEYQYRYNGGYVCNLGSVYQKLEYMQSIDCGNTWTPVIPEQYEIGDYVNFGVCIKDGCAGYYPADGCGVKTKFPILKEKCFGEIGQIEGIITIPHSDNGYYVITFPTYTTSNVNIMHINYDDLNESYKVGEITDQLKYYSNNTTYPVYDISSLKLGSLIDNNLVFFSYLDGQTVIVKYDLNTNNVSYVNITFNEGLEYPLNNYTIFIKNNILYFIDRAMYGVYTMFGFDINSGAEVFPLQTRDLPQIFIDNFSYISPLQDYTTYNLKTQTFESFLYENEHEPDGNRYVWDVVENKITRIYKLEGYIDDRYVANHNTFTYSTYNDFGGGSKLNASDINMQNIFYTKEGNNDFIINTQGSNVNNLFSYRLKYYTYNNNNNTNFCVRELTKEDNILYRWAEQEGNYICEGTNLYQREIYQQSYDGVTWNDVNPIQTRVGQLVEENSLECGWLPAGNPIIFDIEIPLGGNIYHIELPLAGDLDNLVVDWGDYSNPTREIYHNYTNANTGVNIFRISVYGSSTGIDITLPTDQNYDNFRYSLRKIVSWGDSSFNIRKMDYAFRNCINLTEVATNSLNALNNVSSFYEAFLNCTSLTNFPTNFFDNMLNVSNVSRMFYSATQLSGETPKQNGNPLWNITGIVGTSCFYRCQFLSDYNSIPDEWKRQAT